MTEAQHEKQLIERARVALLALQAYMADKTHTQELITELLIELDLTEGKHD